MSDKSAQLTVVQEAEQARQVVNVLARIEQRFADDRWIDGYRFGPNGGNCLIGAIDEATVWALPGVAPRVTAELVAHLPLPFRALGRFRPRLALASYNDSIGGRSGALRLVRETRYALGGLPLIRFVGEARPQPWLAHGRCGEDRPTHRYLGGRRGGVPDRWVGGGAPDRWVARVPHGR